MDAECNQSISPPVTSQPGTSHWSACHRSTRHRADYHQSTSGHQSPVIQWLSGTGHQSPITRHWAFIPQAPATSQPVTGHRAPVNLPGTCHHAAFDRQWTPGSQSITQGFRAFQNEPQNPTVSKTVLLPLEPDFNVSPHFTIVQIIFYFLRDHRAHCGIFENGVLLMYTLESVSSVANFINAYEDSQ